MILKSQGVAKILLALDIFRGKVNNFKDGGEEYVFITLKCTSLLVYHLGLSTISVPLRFIWIYSGHGERQTIYFTKMLTDVFGIPSTLPSAAASNSRSRQLLLPPLLTRLGVFRVVWP